VNQETFNQMLKQAFQDGVISIETEKDYVGWSDCHVEVKIICGGEVVSRDSFAMPSR
jgi:hypothetical protein